MYHFTKTTWIATSRNIGQPSYHFKIFHRILGIEWNCLIPVIIWSLFFQIHMPLENIWFIVFMFCFCFSGFDLDFRVSSLLDIAACSHIDHKMLPYKITKSECGNYTDLCAKLIFFRLFQKKTTKDLLATHNMYWFTKRQTMNCLFKHVQHSIVPVDWQWWNDFVYLLQTKLLSVSEMAKFHWND